MIDINDKREKLKLQDEMTKEKNQHANITASIMNNSGKERSIEYVNYQERLKTKLFRYCELGNLKKLKIILDKNQPNDAIPDINSKFLHDYKLKNLQESKESYEI